MNSNGNLAKIHLNVMEELVKEEVEKQLKLCPSSWKDYINSVEVATYALNRLTPLYASSEKGKHQQKLLGKRQYKEQIKIAVRQGIAAVRRDPIRSCIPLVSDMALKYQSAESALEQLQELFEERDLDVYQKLSWQNLVTEVRKVINKVSWTRETPSNRSMVEEEVSQSRAWYDYREHSTFR